MDPERLHGLVHQDPRAAWPYLVTLIESGQSPDVQSQVFEDIAYSDALPDLIDDIERLFERSTRFQKLLITSRDVLGGRGGPEMDRIFRLVDAAEQRHALVMQVDTLELPPRPSLRGRWAAFRGKTVIYRVRRKE